MAEAHEGWIDDLLVAANADEAAALAGRLHEITTELEGRSK
jgi:hypothetical protein